MTNHRTPPAVDISSEQLARTGLTSAEATANLTDAARRSGTTILRIEADTSGFIRALQRAGESARRLQVAMAETTRCRRHHGRSGDPDGVDPTLCTDCNQRGFYLATGILLALMAVLALAAVLLQAVPA